MFTFTRAVFALLDLLDELARWARPTPASIEPDLPPRKPRGAGHPALVAWAEQHRFEHDARARAWLGKVCEFPTALEIGSTPSSPVQIVMAVPIQVVTPITLTATTIPRDDVERIVSRLFDDGRIAASLVSASILRGVVLLTMVPEAPPKAVELAMVQLARAMMGGRLRPGSTLH